MGMDGGESTTHDASHDALPFRLTDVQVQPKFFDFHPSIPQIRKELIFQWRLIRTEWNRMECNPMEWNAMQWNGVEWNGMEWNAMEWNGMEWNGMEWMDG